MIVLAGCLPFAIWIGNGESPYGSISRSRNKKAQPKLGVDSSPNIKDTRFCELTGKPGRSQNG